MLFFNGSDFSVVPRKDDDTRLREDFNIEGTTTGRAYGAYTDSPSSTTVRLRSQIDELTRQVTDPHDLRFVLFVLDYILAREKPL